MAAVAAAIADGVAELCGRAKSAAVALPAKVAAIMVRRPPRLAVRLDRSEKK